MAAPQVTAYRTEVAVREVVRCPQIPRRHIRQLRCVFPNANKGLNQQKRIYNFSPSPSPSQEISSQAEGEQKRRLGRSAPKLVSQARHITQPAQGVKGSKG